MKLAAAGALHGAPEIDPVCGMAVDEQKARAANRTVEHGGKMYFFCCDSCQEEFKDDPAKFPESAKQPPTALTPTNVSSSPVVNQDPVCGMSVSEPKARAAGRIYESGGKVYLFCNDGCKEEFMADPNKFLKPAVIPSATSIKAAPHRDQPHH